MKIVWSNRARVDLLDSLKYIANDSFNNAQIIRDKIYKAVKMLEEFPDMGVLPKDDILIRMGYKMLIVEKYLIFFYLQKDEEIYITAIKPGATRYGYLIDKE